MKRGMRWLAAAACLMGLTTGPTARAQGFDTAPVGYKVTTNFGDAVATSVQGQGVINTTLTDPRGGAPLATLKWDFPFNTMTWDVPGAGTTTESINDTPPGLTGSNYAVYYIYKNTLYALRLQAADVGGQSPGAGVADNPGCDWFPDPLETPCVRACCDTHDACYAARSPPCTAKSWIPFVGSKACKACNKAVVLCIAKCLKDAIIGKLPQPIEQH